MGTHTRTRRILAALGLSVCGLLAMPTNAGAVGTVSELSVGQGTLLAKGAAIRVSTTYTCEGVSAFMPLLVRQRTSSGALAFGMSFAGETSPNPIVCDGTSRSVTLTVYPDANLNTAFKPGTALATVEFSVCDETFYCTLVTRDAEIRLAHK